MEKLSSLRLRLDADCTQISDRQGSLFHGAIMEILNSEYADELPGHHESYQVSLQRRYVQYLPGVSKCARRHRQPMYDQCPLLQS